MILYSRVSDDGTAMSLATLCRSCLSVHRATYDAVANNEPDTGDNIWYDTTENDAVECRECGWPDAIELPIKETEVSE